MKIPNLVHCLYFCLLAGVSSPEAASLAQIRERGVLIVGVKSDVPLWGYHESTDAPIRGMEPDLALDLAEQLGVNLQLVGVQTADRIEALTAGRVDMLIATLSDTSERQQKMAMVT